MKASTPVSGWTTAVGLSVMKVEVYDVVTATGIAWVRNDKNQNFEIPYRVQRSKGRIPKVGELWYVDRTLGPWTFAAYISPTDADFKLFDNGISIPNGQQVNIGGSPSTASFTAMRSAATDAAYAASVAGDTISRYLVQAGGKIEWGAGGSSARDTNLYRSAANTLKTDDSLIVAGDATVATLTVTGGTSPVWYDTGVDQTSTSTTYAAGSTECGGSFVAPKSGIVSVDVTGLMHVSANTANAVLSAEIRVGTNAGTVVLAADDESAVWVGTTDSVMSTVKAKTVTGLTPGTTYWVRTMFRVTGAITGTASYRRVNVTPFGP